MVVWSRPLRGSFKLNMDASVANGMASGGGILRGDVGDLVFGYYKEFGDLDVLKAEEMALLTGMQMCDQRQLRWSQIRLSRFSW